jgi:hypothetical protein
MQHIKFKKKIKFLETRLQTAIPNGFLARTFFFFFFSSSLFPLFFLDFCATPGKKKKKNYRARPRSHLFLPRISFFNNI